VRVLALDLGSRRIGVAASDPSGVLASPLTVLERGRDHADDHRRIAALVAERGAGLVVVGLPISLDGSCGPAARAALDEVAELRSVLKVPVETADERFTTVSASRQLRDAGKTGRKQAAVIDAAAAAVLLQNWLDGPGGAAVRFEER
jgi:putative Holliday junction resolvase